MEPCFVTMKLVVDAPMALTRPIAHSHGCAEPVGLLTMREFGELNIISSPYISDIISALPQCHCVWKVMPTECL